MRRAEMDAPAGRGLPRPARIAFSGAGRPDRCCAEGSGMMQLWLVPVIVAAVAPAAGPTQEADPKAWETLHPDIQREAVKRVTDAYPLSDQKNAGKWIRYAP